MNFVFILALFLQSFTIQVPPPAVTKSDMPPSISVKMSTAEIKKLEDAEKAVAAAETALDKAKSAQDSAKYDIIKSHRGENLPLAECQFGAAWGITLTWSGTGLGTFIQPEPKGYLGSINGNWVVFTKGFMECNAV